VTELAAERYGDCGVLVWLPDQPSVLTLFSALAARPFDGQWDLVPADHTLLLRFTDASAAESAITEVARRLVPTRPTAETSRLDVEVVYDGPDLADVAARTGNSTDEVVARHSGQDWTVAFTGFAPGFGYLVGEHGGLPVDRRSTPRTEVPAGSVALGGHYSAVYPRSSPGGWQLIGRSAAVLWDLQREVPALLRPGMRVRFRPVDRLPPPTPPVASAPYRFGPSNGAGLRVDRPGALALVQDAGRTGLGSSGVPTSGAADRAAFMAANAAVGNPAGAAVLELVLGGTAVTAVGDQWVAVTGAATEVQIRPAVGPAESVPAGSAVLVRDGDQLRIGRVGRGLRSYLAVRGGLTCSPVLGSRSTDRLSGIGPPVVQRGVLLGVGALDRLTTAAEPGRESADRSGDDLGTLEVTAGPHLRQLPDDCLDELCARTWQVSPATDRVGVRLVGSPLAGGGGALPSVPLVPGAVQLPPSGEPVVFLRDHPTTGGYPVVAVLTDRSVDAAAQLRPGQPVRLERTR
jgi:KipI family sensor histidine kinase inhibitor